MRNEFHEILAINYGKIDTAPSPTGRTDGVFTVVLPSISTVEDEVLVSFEFGDVSHDVDGRDFLIWQRGQAPDVDGRDFLTWQRGQLPDVDVAMETITIAHEGMELM